jgi:hypothetical protein
MDFTPRQSMSLSPRPGDQHDFVLHNKINHPFQEPSPEDRELLMSTLRQWFPDEEVYYK